MEISTEIITTKTLTLNEKDIEDIIRKHLGVEYANANISLYKNTISASSVMGALDDMTEIACSVKLYSKEVS